MVKRKYSEMTANSREMKIEPKYLPSAIYGQGMATSGLNGNIPEMNYTQIVPEAEDELRSVMDDFVQVYERLDLTDDVNTKPNYSYTELVYLAILRSSNFCLPITEIYKYIQSRFNFFRSSTREHWKNAVRHSLSKTKCFTKISVGRGVGANGVINRSTYLWCIIPSSIVSFARGDYRPNVDKESGTNTMRWGYYRVNAGQFWDKVAIYLEQKMQIFRRVIASHPRPGHVFELQKCTLPDKSDREGESEKSPSIETLDIERIVNKKAKTEVIPNEKSCAGTDIAFSNDISPISSRDSGNETMSDSSPEEGCNRYMPTYRMDRPNLNSSYLSSGRVSPDQFDLNRKTPDTFDLGQISPLELSPISTVFPNESQTYHPVPVSNTPIMLPPAYPVPSLGYYDNIRYPHPQYQTAHDFNYYTTPYYQDFGHPYQYNYMHIQGNDPMFSNTADWNSIL